MVISNTNKYAEPTSLIEIKKILTTFHNTVFWCIQWQCFQKCFSDLVHLRCSTKAKYGCSNYGDNRFWLIYFTIFFSALAGQLADKYEKSKLVQIIKIAEILIMGFSFIGFYFENIHLLLTLIFLMGVHSTFFGPIK